MKTPAAATTSLLLLGGSTGASAFVHSVAGRFCSVSQAAVTSKADRRAPSASRSLECPLFLLQGGRRREAMRGTVVQGQKRTESQVGAVCCVMCAWHKGEDDDGSA